MVKDPSELELLATACRISSQAIADVFALIRPGLTERQLAAALDRRMTELGAEGAAFDTIVASGPNGALPHHLPADRPMRRGDLITMDFGARYGGYHADMTRTVALGPPAGWQREIYELVAAAQRAGSRSPSSLVFTCPAGAVSGSRTFLSWGPAGRASSRLLRENFSSFNLETQTWPPRTT